MTSKDVIKLRLRNHRFSVAEFDEAEDVVRWFGAIQAQDFNAAKWSVGLRVKNETDETIEKAYNTGEILRTHIMRPTWHFVVPEDLLWMQRLTSSNVKKLMAHYNRRLELTDDLFKKIRKIVIDALKNRNYLTRQEIKVLLDKAGIQTNVQRLAHAVMWPELDAIICSGPLKEKKITYALTEERIKNFKKLNKDESLATLATKYFQSHGPAQIKDFAWWSGLSIKDSQEALSMIKSKLDSEIINMKEYWFFPNTNYQPISANSAFILSIYDEYTISYKDRSDLNEDSRNIEKMLSMGNSLTAVVILDGKVTGTWKRILKKNNIEIKLNMFRKLNKREISGIKKSALAYGKFFNKKVFI